MTLTHYDETLDVLYVKLISTHFGNLTDFSDIGNASQIVWLKMEQINIPKGPPKNVSAIFR